MRWGALDLLKPVSPGAGGTARYLGRAGSF